MRGTEKGWGKKISVGGKERGGLGWVPSKGGAAGGVCRCVCVGGFGMISLPGRPLNQFSYLVTSV